MHTYFSLLQSHSASKSGQFKEGKAMGNSSLVLSVIAIVGGFLGFLLAGVVMALIYGYTVYCGISGPYSTSCQRGIF